MIKSVMKELCFPVEAIEHLGEKYAELTACEAIKGTLHEAYDRLFGRKDGDFLPLIAEISEKTGVHDHTVEMLLLLNGANTLRYIYNAKGLPDETWLESMSDLRNKLFEYKKLSGLWGTNVGRWFKGYYTLDRFALGRLQFNKGKIPVNCGKFLKEVDVAVFCHIPSSGPLVIDDALDSFRKAREWFKDDFDDGNVPLACSSWLLYPPMTRKLPEHSNIKKFAALFDIYDEQPDPSNSNFWRIFYHKYSPEIMAEIEPKTSLERAVSDMIGNGGSLGVGLGILKSEVLD